MPIELMPLKATLYKAIKWNGNMYSSDALVRAFFFYDPHQPDLLWEPGSTGYGLTHASLVYTNAWVFLTYV